MNEKNILLETAILAKSVGFNWMVSDYYEEDAFEGYNIEALQKGFDGVGDYNNFDEDTHKFYAAPTQSHLQKWLRDVHALYVSVVPVLFVGDEKAAYYYPTLQNNVIDTKLRFKTYEEAFEYGLQKTLITIKQ